LSKKDIELTKRIWYICIMWKSRSWRSGV